MTTWVLDLDGVVWLGDLGIGGAPEAIAALREAGNAVAFCTNNSSGLVAHYEEKLARLGISAEGAVLTSAMAAATLLHPGERVLVCAGDGAREAVLGVGAVAVEVDVLDGASTSGGAVDTVLVGFHTTFDYAAMNRAVRAVLGGARLVATNDDPIYPAADGPAPGCGAILASIERATGRRALIAGKPYDAMARLIRDRLGPSGVFVGDSLATDGAMADVLEWPFGLVLSGNTTEAMVPPDSDRAWVASNLRELVERHLART